MEDEEYDRTRFDFWDVLVEVCSTEPEAFRESMLRVDYLRVFDFLASNSGPYMQNSLRIWRDLGEAAGLDTVALHAQAFATRYTEYVGRIGCSWERCPLHLRDSRRIMQWCEGCGKTVLYCGEFCQVR